MKQSHTKGSPRFTRDVRSPPDAARLTSKDIITDIRMLMLECYEIKGMVNTLKYSDETAP